MANSSAIMTPFRIGIVLLVVGFVSVIDGKAPPKSKRQIYREQVLPSKGGKIPDDAFRTDRLALNRLNKEGISIPDGVLLEHRHVHAHPHINQHDPEDEDSLIKIVQRPEDRYVAPEGKYDNTKPITVSSTYIIRKPHTPVNSAIQPTFHETLTQHHGNQIQQFYPETYYPQQYLRPQLPQKYLPAELTAPPQKYFPVEVEIPPQKHFTAHFAAPPQKYAALHRPYTYAYPPPVSYQQVHQSLAYYPIHVPLELPNKDTLKDGYYSVRSQGKAYETLRDTEDIHGVVNWPFLLKQYTRLSDKINVLDHDSYGQTAPHALFFTPEVLGALDSGSGYYVTGDRYARKSKEIAFTDSAPEPIGKTHPKDSRRLIKLKCTSGSENVVEDGSTQCYIRY